MDTKNCSFCNRPEDETDVLITSENASICDECLRKNVLLVNKKSHELLPEAEEVLGLTMAEIMQVDMHDMFNLQSCLNAVSKNNQQENSLFTFLAQLGVHVNQVRKKTQEKEAKKIRDMADKLDRIDGHLKNLVPND